MAASKREWLLLIHQIPLKPGYLRVKIWRRLQTGRVGRPEAIGLRPPQPSAGGRGFRVGFQRDR